MNDWLELVVAAYDFFAAAASLLADAVTIILGAIAIWGLLFKRKQIQRFFHALTTVYLNQRISRIKETLGQLNSLNFDNKEDKRRIRALLGQICGQLKGLTGDYPVLNELYARANNFHNEITSLTEPLKCELSHEIDGLLDKIVYGHQSDAMRSNNG